MRPEPMITFPVWKARRADPDPSFCLVLMPFGKRHLTKAFEHVLVPVASELGLTAERADHRPEEIMEGIWERMLRARVIVADVTDKNPNVMYELGMVHALGKPILLITAGGGKDITYDLHRYRHILYKTSPQGLEALRASLRDELGVLLELNPTGCQLLDEIEGYAAEWKERNHDSFSLHPEVVNLVRRHLAPDRLSDIVIAYCTATGAHYGSDDHMVFWGRHASSRPASARELAMALLPGKLRRPAVRTARIIEQFPEATREAAIERCIEYRVSVALIEAVRHGRVMDFVREHPVELGLEPEKAATLLHQLPNIRLFT